MTDQNKPADAGLILDSTHREKSRLVTACHERIRVMAKRSLKPQEGESP